MAASSFKRKGYKVTIIEKGHKVNGLYQSIKTAVGAAQFHAVPNMPVTAIVNRLSALINLLEIHNITGVFVFDGEKHERKKVSDIRATTVENAIKKMKAIQKCVVEENGGVALGAHKYAR